MGGRRRSISAISNLINKGMWGQTVLFYTFLFLYSPIWSDFQRDEVNQESSFEHNLSGYMSVFINSQYLQIQNFI